MSDSITKSPIRLDDAPAWDETTEIHDVVVRLLSPREAEERTDRRPDLLAERRPGLVLRLVRWVIAVVWKEPAPDRPGDAEQTEALRDLCKAFIPAHHHQLIDRLNGGELMDLFMLYRGLQVAHADRVQAWATARAGRPEAPATAEVAQSGSAEHGLPQAAPPAKGVQRVSVPRQQLIPGQPLPAWLGARRRDDAGKGA